MSSTPTNIIVDAKAITQRLRGPDGTLTILESLDFQLQPREAAAILGASGSGKSTLLGLLAGLDVPSDGDIYLLGQNLTTLDEDGRATLRAGQVGFVFQSFQLLPTLSALENVRLPLELAEQPLERAEALLDAVGLGHRLHHLPGHYRKPVASKEPELAILIRTPVRTSPCRPAACHGRTLEA